MRSFHALSGIQQDWIVLVCFYRDLEPGSLVVLQPCRANIDVLKKAASIFSRQFKRRGDAGTIPPGMLNLGFLI